MAYQLKINLKDIKAIVEQCLKPLQHKCLFQAMELKKQENDIEKNLKEIEDKIFTTSSTPIRQTQQIRPTTFQMPSPQQLIFQLQHVG